MTFQDYTDEMLLDLMRDSVEEAFTELYLRYWRKLYAASLKRMSSEEDAKDLIQELFVKLWLRRRELPDHMKVAEYLYTALRFRIINYIQADQVRIKYANTRLAEMQPDVCPAEDPYLARQELEALIEGALEGMPERMQEVFLLSYKKGFTPKEIAATLSLSVQTVKNYLTNARIYLKGRIASEDSDLYAHLLMACAYVFAS